MSVESTNSPSQFLIQARESAPLDSLNRAAHVAHCKRCLSGLPDSQIELDSSRLAIAFYCIGTFDLLGTINEKKNDTEAWKDWIWEQQARGKHGTGFKSGSFMTPQSRSSTDNFDSDLPHLIMTYTALLALSSLRDDFSKLDRPGITKFLRACQREDGSFSTVPEMGDSDIRTVYCAFAVSSMLDDWSGVDVARAISFIQSCRTYEGGYGQSPFCEAQGGTTYCAIASLCLAHQADSHPNSPLLTLFERQKTIRWLVQNQDPSGGFCGRTNKDADACYCFWCGASLQLLGAKQLVDDVALSQFLARCQFKYGGISKVPTEHPDPYHTYLSLAALSMYQTGAKSSRLPESWIIEDLNPLLNATRETVAWARAHIPKESQV